ncbi:uncharacterized protein LOC126212896 [Schistocerca nitens]|uniref:uncharacterized protein LOC126212896 n=1 Tax=Schistocerca nitens TaxID=7011 RepID=UPI00211885D5|nr:uncharacterized protein LOC126212896 [Schistocerca nitens]
MWSDMFVVGYKQKQINNTVFSHARFEFKKRYRRSAVLVHFNTWLYLANEMKLYHFHQSRHLSKKCSLRIVRQKSLCWSHLSQCFSKKNMWLMNRRRTLKLQSPIANKSGVCI